jgi:hypothetical protein
MNEVRQSSAKVFISSYNPAQWSTPTSNTSLSVNIAPFVLNSKDTTHFVIGIECLSVPLALYTVNDNNNTIIVTNPSVGSFTYTIPIGNYTAKTITDYLNSITVLTGITWVLDPITNKYVITSVITPIAFTGSATTLLGYVSSDTTIVIPPGGYTFPSTINLTYTTGILIRLDNIQTENRDSETGSSSIIGRIPITVAPFKVLQYFNAQPFYTTINNRYINNIKVSLLDDDYRPLVLVGNPQWNMTLRIDFADKVQQAREQKLIEAITTGNMLTNRK